MGVLNTTPRTWVTSEVVTAAEMNTEIRDPLTNLQASWTSYVPVLTNISIAGGGTVVAAYQRVGKRIDVRCRLAATAGTVWSAGTLGISAPFTPHTDYTAPAGQDYAVGAGIIQPTSRQGATVVFATTGSGVFNFIVDNLASSNVVTNLVPGTFGSSSVITFTASYEAA